MSEEKISFKINRISEDADLEYFKREENPNYYFCYISSIEETAVFVQIYKKNLSSINLYKASLNITFQYGIQYENKIIGFFREGFPISFDLDYDIHRNLLHSPMKVEISIQEITIDDKTYENELKNKIKFTQYDYKDGEDKRNIFDKKFNKYLQFIKNHKLISELPKSIAYYHYFEQHRHNFLDIDVSDFYLVVPYVNKEEREKRKREKQKQKQEKQKQEKVEITKLICKDISTGKTSKILNFMDFIHDDSEDLYEIKDPESDINRLGPIPLHRAKYWLPGNHYYLRIKRNHRLFLAQDKDYKVKFSSVEIHDGNKSKYMALTPYKTGPIIEDREQNVFIHIDVLKTNDFHIIKNTIPHIYYEGEEDKVPKNEQVYDARQIQISADKNIIIAFSNKFI